SLRVFLGAGGPQDPVDAIVPDHDPADFYFFSISGGLTYQWYGPTGRLSDGGGYSGTHSQLLHISAAGNPSLGLYHVAATSSGGRNSIRAASSSSAGARKGTGPGSSRSRSPSPSMRIPGCWSSTRPAAPCSASRAPASTSTPGEARAWRTASLPRPPPWR